MNAADFVVGQIKKVWTWWVDEDGSRVEVWSVNVTKSERGVLRDERGKPMAFNQVAADPDLARGEVVGDCLRMIHDQTEIVESLNGRIRALAKLASSDIEVDEDE